MYVPGFGSCSAIIHLVAKHPKLTLGVGLLALTSYLVSPLGPGHYSGSSGILRAQESQIMKTSPELEREFPQAEAAFNEVASVPISDQAIQTVIKACLECHDLKPADVRKDPQLMRDISYVYFLELCHESGIVQAKIRYLNQ